MARWLAVMMVMCSSCAVYADPFERTRLSAVQVDGIEPTPVLEWSLQPATAQEYAHAYVGHDLRPRRTGELLPLRVKMIAGLLCLTWSW